MNEFEKPNVATPQEMDPKTKDGQGLDYWAWNLYDRGRISREVYDHFIYVNSHKEEEMRRRGLPQLEHYGLFENVGALEKFLSTQQSGQKFIIRCTNASGDVRRRLDATAQEVVEYAKNLSQEAMEHAKKRIQKLRETIEYHQCLHHVLDKPEISEQALDSLKHELATLEAEYPENLPQEAIDHAENLPDGFTGWKVELKEFVKTKEAGTLRISSQGDVVMESWKGPHLLVSTDWPRISCSYDTSDFLPKYKWHISEKATTWRGRTVMKKAFTDEEVKKMQDRMLRLIRKFAPHLKPQKDNQIYIEYGVRPDDSIYFIEANDSVLMTDTKKQEKEEQREPTINEQIYKKQ